MSRSLKFANTLAKRFRDPVPEVVQIRHKWYGLKGRFDTGVEVVSLEVFIPWHFGVLKQEPPAVACKEPWMKTGAEWHNGRFMCWVITSEWCDVMNWKGKPIQHIIDEGVEWLCVNVSSLANRHYCAHLEGIEKWPEDWAYWDHYQAGLEQYEREKRAAKR